MYYKVYRKGKTRSHRRYSSECLDIEYSISLSSLKFPANSDKLPDSMKTTETHGHHHHHHHGMMGDDHGMFGGHDWLMGNDSDGDDDEQDGEDESDEDWEPEDDDLDEEGNRLLDGSKNQKNPLPDVDESEAELDLESPNGNGFDDRLIQEGPDSGEINSAELSSGLGASDQKTKSDRKSARKDSKRTSDSSRSKFHEAVDSDLNSLVSSKNDRTKRVDLLHTIETPKVDGDWPYNRERWSNIGQVSALGMDGKHMLLLHRGNRIWDGK